MKKNVKIIDQPRKIIFCVIGELEHLCEVKEFLSHLDVITCEITKSPEDSSSRMEIICPVATHEAIMNLLEDFISG